LTNFCKEENLSLEKWRRKDMFKSVFTEIEKKVNIYSTKRGLDSLDEYEVTVAEFKKASKGVILRFKADQ